MEDFCEKEADSHGHATDEYEQRTDDDIRDVMSFLDLPWEDVVFPMILPCLPLQTLFQLRRVSLKGKALIKEYFRISREVNIARIALRVTEGAFKILTEDRCNLQKLNLRNAKDWLSDKIFIPLLKNNPRLQMLDLTNVTSLSNSSMQVLAVNCLDLRTLILRECHWLSSEGLTVIALNCRELHSVDLTGCWNVNDEAITVLVMSCKKIKYISLAKIYGLTDIAMSVLARECTSLNHLNVQGCWRISDDSVRLLAEYSPNLRALQIRECRDVTEMVLSKLREKKVKIDVRPPPSIHNARMGFLSSHLRQRLNVQI